MPPFRCGSSLLLIYLDSVLKVKKMGLSLDETSKGFISLFGVEDTVMQDLDIPQRDKKIIQLMIKRQVEEVVQETNRQLIWKSWLAEKEEEEARALANLEKNRILYQENLKDEQITRKKREKKIQEKEVSEKYELKNKIQRKEIRQVERMKKIKEEKVNRINKEARKRDEKYLKARQAAKSRSDREENSNAEHWNWFQQKQRQANNKKNIDQDGTTVTVPRLNKERVEDQRHYEVAHLLAYLEKRDRQVEKAIQEKQTAEQEQIQRNAAALKTKLENAQKLRNELTERFKNWKTHLVKTRELVANQAKEKKDEERRLKSETKANERGPESHFER
ncbi:vicilin-like seed storage protein At2g18540 [Eurytemora carolleeae]|uniref:vicilin-like seed storage protein At2g18540 n=1 Tax=Eurytemora carolleeae TaxID=1294199 RepID=UPI000C76270F|nr:vicilin-like seed storage protein At2g18540 [Eurytemora carolleeae]|eukprot:XP_023322765.1 vicilin-like seed storage protein At2g18540 [Eurytemora affinis]